MIIWLASYPGSGNTYFRIILNTVFGIKTPTVYGTNDHPAHVIGHDIVGFVSNVKSLEEMANGKELVIVKTHNQELDGFPGIYIHRDGRDALVSYAHKKEFDDSMVYEEALQSSIQLPVKNRHGSWGANACHWLNRDSKNTCYVGYKSLIENPVPTVTAALKYVGFPLPKPLSEAPKFDHLQSINNHFFRRGIVGSYKKEMPTALENLFWSYPENIEAFERLGYKR